MKLRFGKMDAIPSISGFGKPVWWVLGGVAALLVVALAITITGLGQANAPATNRPVVAFMSSIALATGEGDIADFVGGAATADPFYVRLSQRFDLQPIDDLRRLEAMAPDALLLIQPRGFGPTENVALDDWVRGGGRMILLTDPDLRRESRFAKGDARAPMHVGLAAPLLRHWGIDLTLPIDEPAPVVERTVGDFTFETATPGAFVYVNAQAETTAPCRIKAKGLIAQCDFGTGRAALVADADFVDARFWNNGEMFSSDEGVAMIEAQLDAMTAR